MASKHTSDSLSWINPIGMGKSTAYDDDDAHDDEMQRFSLEATHHATLIGKETTNRTL